MALAILNSCALSGMSSALVRAEIHIGAGLPNFFVVGLTSTGAKETRDRVRVAITNSGFEFPVGRITVNLSLADLPTESRRFDLPIALGVLMATGQLRLSSSRYKTLLPHLYFVGELSLSGALCSIQAPLMLALSIFKSDPKAVLVLPRADAAMAALVDGLTVIGANSLREVVAHLESKQVIEASRPNDFEHFKDGVTHADDEIELCLSDVRGQKQACHLLELAACGAHSILFSGPSGVGKSMLAQRLPTILPDLNDLQRLELFAIQSVSASGLINLGHRPAFRTIHNSISEPALFGGGTHAYPGEISLCHHGVLFLEEMAEFKRSTLEALRVPLEMGEISISRSGSQQVYPARFQLVAAANPCACGYLDHPEIDCVCTHRAVNQYQSKISGPLLERIDIHCKVSPLAATWLDADSAAPSKVVRQRVLACRAIQLTRQGVLNAHLKGVQIKQYCTLSPTLQRELDVVVQQKAWSTRVVQAILKIARTAADMRGVDEIEREDLELSISCREPFSKKEEGRLYWHEARKGTSIRH
ncbi:Competence protein ComM [Oligella ureolytica]|uniref:YifB family Mg chelatase-like AAA ATPase n=1 Tax=Oligella ureolytica TaxID=90244 RepID=UPI000E06CBA1|nr:YifB family Mg chelatase-like AAA ATPase [Oligella ureolytica]SUA51174.1 Competence protein ComM [Oligella ureolytica]